LTSTSDLVSDFGFRPRFLGITSKVSSFLGLFNREAFGGFATFCLVVETAVVTSFLGLPTFFLTGTLSLSFAFGAGEVFSLVDFFCVTFLVMLKR
jgi:hypothetical protein